MGPAETYVARHWLRCGEKPSTASVTSRRPPGADGRGECLHQPAPEGGVPVPPARADGEAANGLVSPREPEDQRKHAQFSGPPVLWVRHFSSCQNEQRYQFWFLWSVCVRSWRQRIGSDSELDRDHRPETLGAAAARQADGHPGAISVLREHAGVRARLHA